MKKSRKILIISLILLSIMFITKIPSITNVSQAASVTVKKSIKGENSKIVVDTTTKNYTGKKIKRKISITVDGKKLESGKDYKVTYKNNKNPGKATITIKGIGEYTGTIKKSFYIRPKKAKLYSAKVYKFDKAKIHWKKDSKADGYRIYMATSKNGKYKKIKTIKDENITTYIKSNLDPDTKYYFKIRSYKYVNGKMVFSKYSNVIKKDLPSKLLAEVTLTASSSTVNRNHNIKLASKACNNIVLKPGENFVWSKVVGEATYAKGYRDATIFVNKKPQQGTGGGVCQVSSTIYQTAKKCKLKIIERHTHSLPVSYTTKGKDATVAYGSKNLIFKNNKSYSIKIEVTSNKKSCTCKIYRI